MVSKTRLTKKDPEGPRRTKKDQVRLSKLLSLNGINMFTVSEEILIKMGKDK